MNDYASWCTSLEQTLGVCNQGEPLDLEAVKRLGQQARSLGPSLTPEQREHVKHCVATLSGMIREGMRRMDEELSGIGERRAGVRGYGQLRATHTGQRLRRRV